MNQPGPLPRERLDRIFRDEYGRVVAALARRLGDLGLAEEAAGDAVLVAVERWPVDGVPPNPGGWLMTTAHRKAIDRLRRESTREARHQEAQVMQALHTHEEPGGPVEDDRLRLIFTCCHPALAPESRVALTLRLLGGLTVPEIASAFLVSEDAMGQRITRAKRKIKLARIPYRVPAGEDLVPRLSGVLSVVYLVFNEGYLSSSGGPPVRAELTGEAIRLGRVLRGLLPDQPEVTGLLALMLLTEARREARVEDGVLVPLPEQDRSRWDAAMIAEGHALVRECLAIGRPGHYQLLAAVNAVHTSAATAEETDWLQIAALYGQLYAVSPTPIIALNRAVAVAEVDGPAVALAEVDRLDLPAYTPWHATRADLLRRLGREEEARAAYDAAVATSDNDAERAFLVSRRDSS